MNFWHSWHFHPVHSPTRFFIEIAILTVVFIAAMVIIHRLAPRVKKYLIIACTFLAGLFTVIEYVLPVRKVNGEEMNRLTPFLDPVNNFITNVVIWTIGLGVISLVIVHGRRLLRRQAGWVNSIGFFVALIVMLWVGFASWAGKGPADTHLQQSMHNTYTVLFNGLLINLDSAMFALLAFYIASASYRAFRVRSVEAALLMFSALIVMLGVVSFGVLLTSWIGIDGPWRYFRIEQMSAWLLNWINAPGYRAVLIGVQVGALAMAMRLWLSLERGAFFSQE